MSQEAAVGEIIYHGLTIFGLIVAPAIMPFIVSIQKVAEGITTLTKGRKRRTEEGTDGYSSDDNYKGDGDV